MERPDTPRLLRAYLADHQQLHRAGRELALRVRGREPDAELAELLDDVAGELRRQEQLAGVFLRQLGAGEPHLRLALAVLAERIGRLKPNGRLFTSSPLAPVFELEVLESLLEISARAWRALDHAGVVEGGLVQPRIAACERLAPALERHRLAAARTALVPLGGDG
ncbi:MAG TPA: hypothetical protein VFG74_04320 [Miltoncostaeaceae bacterium]|jgi:hypothetical protein|nr:hypothetical protein [Miltoncostaeaceae bacterium]